MPSKKSPRRLFLLAPLAGLSLLFCSCAVDTPQTRIANNGAAYDSLSPRHQALVERGQIEKGMPKKGVRLALGSPRHISHGQRDGTDFERWTYTRLQPVYHQRLFASYGYGGYRYCGRRRGYYGLGYAPSIEYYPARSATVFFRGDKVDSWERYAP